MNQVDITGSVVAISYYQAKGGVPAQAIVKIHVKGPRLNVIPVTFQGRQADILDQYVNPGDVLAVAGALQMTGNGLEVVGDHFMMMSMAKAAGVAK